MTVAIKSIEKNPSEILNPSETFLDSFKRKKSKEHEHRQSDTTNEEGL